MTVFAIRQDDWKFQHFVLDSNDFIEYVPEEDYTMDDIFFFSQNNTRFSPWWNNVESRYTVPEGFSDLAIPDLATWEGATIILSPKAYNALCLELEPYGEFLPTSCNGTTYYIFNCLTEGMIDEINSKYKALEGEMTEIKALHFNTNDVDEKLVFKTKFDGCSVLYCNEKFKRLVEKNELTGLRFSSNFTL